MKTREEKEASLSRSSKANDNLQTSFSSGSSRAVALPESEESGPRAMKAGVVPRQMILADSSEVMHANAWRV